MPRLPSVRIEQGLSEPGGPVAESEWVLTNGLGGFAMGTASGVPTRRYHGWLIGATRPPLGRVVGLHSAAEWLVVPDGASGERRFDLATYRFHDGTMSPGGTGLLARFERSAAACRWVYALPGGVEVQRELVLARERNALAVRYTVRGAARGTRLEVRPFTPMRDFHELAWGKPVDTRVLRDDEVCVSDGGCELSLRMSGAHFVAEGQVWRRFAYVRDRERGQGSEEDLTSPGVFVCDVSSGKAGSESAFELRAELSLRGAQKNAAARWGETDAELRREEARLESLAAQAGVHSADDIGRALVCAADQFVVRRNATGDEEAASFASVIAGYPWFSDWGRDTCISIPGLMLACGRFGEALASLRAFAALQRDGLIPNCFDDGNGSAQYNTVDASLWFLHAACEYVRASGDMAGFGRHLAGPCTSVVEAYIAGTRWGIRMDQDGLVMAGNAGTQLTWMDAERDGVVMTPRHGKPVEISALWYSGLMSLAGVLARLEGGTWAAVGSELQRRANVTGRSFVASFWDEQNACLRDCLLPGDGGGWNATGEVRPNQIFAASLPHSPLTQEQRSGVVRVVKQQLLTDMGLRTLASGDASYRARYEGSLFERDRAYHNGTVWPWLIGPYCEAVLRLGSFGDKSKQEVRSVLAPLADELMWKSVPAGSAGTLDRRRPILTLAEVYDGDGAACGAARSRRPDGCIAQAWSVAEVLRLWLLSGDGAATQRP